VTQEQIEAGIREESISWQRIRDQAKRYMEGYFGPSVWFKAPETFENVLIRWVWAIARGHIDFAEEQMAHIERMIQEQKEADRAELQRDEMGLD
jgi:hypothetical protein